MSTDLPCFDRALFLTRATLEVLFDYDQKLRKYPSFYFVEFLRITSSWPARSFTSNAKFFTAWPMAKFLKNPLPETPEHFGDNHPLIFRGALRRYLKSRLIADTNKNAQLFIGFLQGVKRGCAPVSPDDVEAKMLKHRATLLKEPMENWADYDVLDDLTPYVQKILKGLHFDQPKLFEASQSASFNTKRSDGGGRDFIRHHYAYEYGHDELVSMTLERGQGRNRVHEIRGVPPPPLKEVLTKCLPDLYDDTPPPLMGYESQDFAVPQVVNPFQNNDSRAFYTPVMVAAVLEPLKVRLITKGSEFTYWLARYVQKTVHGYLRELEPFRLIGEPLTEVHLDRMMERARTIEQLNDTKWSHFVSGDYSSATDGLKTPVTRMVFEQILEKLPETGTMTATLKDVLRSVLYEQEIHYPCKMGLEPALQKNGQLMGSVLSFVVLCIVNLATYWKSLDDYLDERCLPKVKSVSELPALVNGDDILFPSDLDHYEIWKREIPRVGFELSLGKNYIHQNLLTANSQYYRYRPDKSNDFHQLTYLNTGLLTGQVKITGRKNAQLTPIWDLYNLAVHTSMNPVRTHRRFMHYHLETIRRLTANGKYNLFAAHLRGGLGCLPPKDLEIRFTSFQQRWATFVDQKFVEGVECGDILRGSRVALVRERDRKDVAVREHHRKLYLSAKIGPHLAGAVPPKDGLFRYSPLCRPGDDNEGASMVVRFPRPGLLRKFEEAGYSKMSYKDMFESPHRVMSYDGSTHSEFLPETSLIRSQNTTAPSVESSSDDEKVLKAPCCL